MGSGLTGRRRAMRCSRAMGGVAAGFTWSLGAGAAVWAGEVDGGVFRACGEGDGESGALGGAALYEFWDELTEELRVLELRD